MSTTRTFGVVVVGAGDMGARHAQHWQAAGGDVVAIVDPDTERARACAALVGATAIAEAATAFADPRVDVVSVCTPTFLHAPYTIAALEAGKHVLCEKPVALSLADAQAMASAAERHDRALRIGFMRRFDPAFETLMAHTAQIGRPLLAQATITAGIRPKRLMHDALANGGPIIDMCCHVFDLWGRMLQASPTTVSAHGYTFADDKPEVAHIAQRAVDSAAITLTYPEGSVGQVQVSWGLPAGIEASERHSYVGPHGLVSADWPAAITLQGATGVTRWSNDGTDPWRAEIFQFKRELFDGAARQVADISDGSAALRVSLAALEAIRTRQSISPAELGATPSVTA